MKKCPKCKREIDCLGYLSKVEVEQTFDIDKEGNPYYSVMDEYGDHSDERYICPECNHVLFTDEEKAIKFLMKK